MRPTGLVAVLIMSLGMSAVSVAGAKSARADTIDVDIARLEEEDGDYKLRIAAALRLAKTRDRRSVQAFISLLEDPKGRSTLRRIAALSLGSMIDTSTSTALRRRVTRLLTETAENERDRKVRRNARRSLRRLDDLAEAPPEDEDRDRPPPRTEPRSSHQGGVFIQLGLPRDRTRRSPKGLDDTLREVLRRTLQRHTPRYRLDWPSGDPPTTAELTKAGMRAYHVRTAVMAYEVRKRGRQAEVQCTVSIQVNPWHGSDAEERWSEREAASATGRGRALGNTGKGSIASAKRDCAVAVTERITTEQVVPFLRKLERSARR